MRFWKLLATGMAAPLWLATQASALPETVFTIGAPLPFAVGASTGTIDPIDPLLINNGLSALDSVCLAGVCDILNQDWAVFEVTVTAGSINDIGVGLLTESALGMGYFLSGGPVQDGTGLTDTYTGSLAVPTVPVFTFLDNSTTAGLQGTSLVLFVAYANNLLPQNPPVPFNVFGPGAVRFMITEYGSAAIVTVGENFDVQGEVIPEPSTALLVGLGCLLLGARARQRRA